MVQAIYHVSGIGPTVNGRNGEGEASRRRGAIALARKDILPSRRFERGVRTSYPRSYPSNYSIFELSDACSIPRIATRVR